MMITVIAGSILALTNSTAASATPSPTLVRRTEIALVEQIRCKGSPSPALAINAMRKNGMVRYVATDGDGVYLFAPTVSLTFLGLPISYLSGFDRNQAFRGVPTRRMSRAPMFVPQFLQIQVAAGADVLRQRALAAGLAQANIAQNKAGFEVAALGPTKSSIECDF